MNRLISRFQSYGHYHTKHATIITHLIGVPLVTFSLMLLLSWVKLVIPGFFATNLAWLAVLCLIIFYLTLDISLGFFSTIGLIILCLIASAIGRYGPTMFSFWVFIITFLVGWIFQFYGHFIEKKRPALFDNLAQALIAPIFVTAEFCFMLGFRKDLQQALKNRHQE